uniref:C-type lectin domain-containing protein n=1 Tax=Amphiprion percula TaxID=161767 RepID=A0A3P8UDZ7_AMPPE
MSVNSLFTLKQCFLLCITGRKVLCSFRVTLYFQKFCYYFVNNPLTWNESQTYCRQKYTDLATIENTEDMKELESLVSSANVKSEVWFGLYSEINWKWSDGFTGSGAEYRTWTSGGNKFAMGSFCKLPSICSGLLIKNKCNFYNLY